MFCPCSRPTAVNLQNACQALSAAAKEAAAKDGATAESTVEAVVAASEAYFAADVATCKVSSPPLRTHITQRHIRTCPTHTLLSVSLNSVSPLDPYMHIHNLMTTSPCLVYFHHPYRTEEVDEGC